jgi:hypothetical protein
MKKEKCCSILFQERILPSTLTIVNIIEINSICYQITFLNYAKHPRICGLENNSKSTLNGINPV